MAEHKKPLITIWSLLPYVWKGLCVAFVPARIVLKLASKVLISAGRILGTVLSRLFTPLRTRTASGWNMSSGWTRAQFSRLRADIRSNPFRRECAFLWRRFLLRHPRLYGIASQIAAEYRRNRGLYFWSDIAALLRPLVRWMKRSPIFGSFFCSGRWAIPAYTGGAFLLYSIFWQVQMTVQLNTWRKDLYDILGDIPHHTFDDFKNSMYVFSWIVAKYVALAVVTYFITRVYALGWRAAITDSFLRRWMKARGQIEGASQRIQEDTRDLAELVESLVMRAVRALMTIIAFTPILLMLSEALVTETIIDQMPGSLLGLSIGSSVIGFGVAVLIGLKLSSLQYTNQKVEAAYRDRMVLHERGLAALTLEIVRDLFTEVKFNYFRLYVHSSTYDLWSTLFAQMMVIVPILLCATSLFKGLITLGIMMQIFDAFERVTDSFSFFLDNWLPITKLLSVNKRLGEFNEFLPQET